MAIVQNTLIGRARKKIGNTVFATLKGQNILRAKPLTVAQPQTPKKLMRQSALAQIVAMYRANAAAIKLGYTPNKQKQSPYNSFASDNLRDAFDYTAPPTATLVPAQLKFSKGTVAETGITSATASDASNTVSVTHPTTATGPGQSVSDEALITMYNTTKNESASVTNAGLRSNATASGPFPANWAAGDVLNVMLSFQNAVTGASSNGSTINITIGA
jgi:hypothetical protein